MRRNLGVGQTRDRPHETRKRPFKDAFNLPSRKTKQKKTKKQPNEIKGVPCELRSTACLNFMSLIKRIYAHRLAYYVSIACRLLTFSTRHAAPQTYIYTQTKTTNRLATRSNQ